jgi:hypothetical protein
VGRYLEEVNARRGSADGARVTPACRVRTPWVRQTPEVVVDSGSVLADVADHPSKRHEGKDPPRGGARYRGGKTSEGEKPKGVTGMKQGRRGFGRSKASRGRENLKALHSRVRQARCRSLPVSASAEGPKTPWKAAAARSPPTGPPVEVASRRTLIARRLGHRMDGPGAGPSAPFGAAPRPARRELRLSRTGADWPPGDVLLAIPSDQGTPHRATSHGDMGAAPVEGSRADRRRDEQGAGHGWGRQLLRLRRTRPARPGAHAPGPAGLPFGEARERRRRARDAARRRRAWWRHRVRAGARRRDHCQRGATMRASGTFGW